MSPAAHALDRRLDALRMAHEAVGGTLAGIEADGTYAVLAAGSLISGVTAARAHPALVRIEEVRRALDVVGRLLDEVAALRSSGQLDEKGAAEVFAYLNSPSIVHNDQSMALQDLLVTLGESLVPPLTVVREVDTVWREFVPRLDQATAEAERLALAIPTVRSLDAARDQLATLAGRVVHDPLGAADELAAVAATLESAAGVAGKMPGLREALTEAAVAIDELKVLIAEGRDAHARSRTEISDATGLVDPVDPAVIEGERGLGPWLIRLNRLVTEGQVDLAKTGLASWKAFADQTLATARQVADINARPVHRRRELRNLLRAARVKAGASGRAEDPRLTELAGRADAALAAPCRLADAEARVAEYVEELRLSPTPAQAQHAGPTGRSEIAS